MLADGDVQRVESDGIGGDARLPVLQEDDRLRERLAALRVADVAGQDDRPGLRQGREPDERQDCSKHRGCDQSRRILTGSWG